MKSKPNLFVFLIVVAFAGAVYGGVRMSRANADASGMPDGYIVVNTNSGGAATVADIQAIVLDSASYTLSTSATARYWVSAKVGTRNHSKVKLDNTGNRDYSASCTDYANAEYCLVAFDTANNAHAWDGSDNTALEEMTPEGGIYYDTSSEVSTDSRSKQINGVLASAASIHACMKGAGGGIHTCLEGNIAQCGRDHLTPIEFCATAAEIHGNISPMGCQIDDVWTAWDRIAGDGSSHTYSSMSGNTSNPYACGCNYEAGSGANWGCANCGGTGNAYLSGNTWACNTGSARPLPRHARNK